MTEEQKARAKVLYKRTARQRKSDIMRWLGFDSLGRENALTNEVNRLKAERLEEENKDLALRAASAEMHADRVSKNADKMKELLDDAAELMRQYDALLVRLLDLNKKMNKWLGF